MDSRLPTREEALGLLSTHVKDNYQRLHAKMVAEALGAYAKKLGEDDSLWYITGLLHDLDYYEFPNEHPRIELDWFKEWNYPREMIHAVEAHARSITGTEPQSKLACAILAVDELAGFLYAYSLMRPGGFIGMDATSVKKKFKDKTFARKIDRGGIKYGVEKFGVEFGEHVSFLISVFRNMDGIDKV
ncbi:HD domain-containing protein [candidate division WWE3 bacterium]|nr:HD domain-containing protein [candidate division WWE3 bacterium]